MTVCLYMDEHVPSAIAKGLRQRGVNVLTIQEDNRSGYSDSAMLDRATELGRALFSQDEDLPIEASRRQAEEIYFAGVVYGRQGDVSIGDCVRDLELIAKVCDLEDVCNRIHYLPL